jgi:hypothetical protein
LTAATVAILVVEFFRSRRRPIPTHIWLRKYERAVKKTRTLENHKGAALEIQQPFRAGPPAKLMALAR